MSRRNAREVALQALFQLDFNEMESVEALESALNEKKNMSDSAREYAKILVCGTKNHLSKIDELISKHSTEWKVNRMPSVDRNIVRIALYELGFSEEKLAANIVINEAVELAKRFGTDSSPKFVNGILGAFIKEAQ
ncbi:transcription antitermination factor NusB [Anaerosinus sp.]|uniref:transcription antitermination factor NusB n=1 Tax=Selenobaculum sp. TaxID=3074374 RepID=UPI0015AC8033